MIRERLKTAQIAAMKSGEKDRLATIRLMLAKVKDRDIELRMSQPSDDDDAMIIDVLQKMVKQRRESIAMFEQGGRTELAAVEQAELIIIEEFLPAQLDEAATIAIIDAIKAETGASSMKDMGKVVALLKQRHGSELDMSKASALVKSALS
ncbi:aspartyl-tRNA amidotransferase [Sphingorhabdus lutea]|uniref:Aspartyl-tRNA amidotransferase n=1 Tax=Sphingorhabdus lutea TaxID=1913578 RepID=A0A1L3JC80_9SPHN|nr:GatB/YqeY domain-containing protein [Sphingorhabdus lutea]APG62745.1 aspartyl-tRNA amidotransferase [Sphingorhabdus lutea]